MISLPKNVLYYGREEPLPEEKLLQAGRLSVTLVEGVLLSICWDGHEILRRVYFAVRDHNWGTASQHIRHLAVHQEDPLFRVTYKAVNLQDDIHMEWSVRIEGTANGTLNFAIEGEACSTFLRNRIGFCLLHPADKYAGRPFSVRQDDGSTIEGRFPEAIALEQPLPGTERMQTLAWNVCNGLTAECEFIGDIFQMEDQRNWTDATFKTFCTPLSLPYPLKIEKGSRISQTVALHIRDSRTSHLAAEKNHHVEIVLGPHTQSCLPQIGVSIASHGQILSSQELSRLRALHFSHLRVDLYLSNSEWRNVLVQSCIQAEQLHLPLEMALFLSDNGEQELQNLADQLRTKHPEIKQFFIFHIAEKTTSSRWVNAARMSLSSLYPAVRWGAGTNAYFYQLMQNGTLPESVDSICYSIHPQEHAFDNRSLMETLAMQGETVRNLRTHAPGRAIVISPVTLKPRFNPNATGAIPTPVSTELPPQVDVRQMSLFGAAWTLGSLQSLADAGVESVTYYETTGWRGVMEIQSGPPLPKLFKSIPGSVFPMYHVLADIGEWKKATLCEVQCSAPLAVACLALSQNGRRRLLLANLTPEHQNVIIEGLQGSVRARAYSDDSILEAMTSPEEFRSKPGKLLLRIAGQTQITLPPYATMKIDE